MNKKWVVLGEKNWSENERIQTIDFDELDKFGFHLNSRLELEIHDSAGNWFQVGGVLWRGQFDREPLRQHSLLSFLKCFHKLPKNHRSAKVLHPYSYRHSTCR